jgi:hypothetical protein
LKLTIVPHATFRAHIFSVVPLAEPDTNKRLVGTCTKKLTSLLGSFEAVTLIALFPGVAVVETTKSSTICVSVKVVILLT